MAQALYSSGSKNLSPNRITAIQEGERQRIGLELHDGIAQWLTAAHQRLHTLVHTTPEDKGQLKELESILNESLGELRRIMADLQIPAMTNRLSVELFHLLQELRRENGVNFYLRLDGEPASLPAWQEITIYRIAQEALNNVRKHAQAGNISLHLSYEPKNLTLEIRDDGRGFDMTETRKKLIAGYHLGLKGLQERAVILGGRAQLWSQPGAGMRIYLTVPYRRQSS